MPRQAGSRNKDFEEKRQELVRALTEHALTDDIRRPSLREFAHSCGVTEPTLRHYFVDRQGTVLAILDEMARRGKVIWDLVAAPSENEAEALNSYFTISKIGIQDGGFIRAHAFGIIEGLADPDIGKAYLEKMLEPSLKSVMTKIQLSAKRNISDTELRSLALVVFSPLLLASLHQDLLGGRETSEINADALTGLLESSLVNHLTAAT
ncbi:MAG: TetR/AcrR family transcriptional regulator [Pseudomonadota bacterium]